MCCSNEGNEAQIGKETLTSLEAVMWFGMIDILIEAKTGQQPCLANEISLYCSRLEKRQN